MEQIGIILMVQWRCKEDKVWKKSCIIIGLLIIICFIAGRATAVTVDPTVLYSTQQNGYYTNYTFASEQYYEGITANSTNISFKLYNTIDVNFNVTSIGSNINITFFYIANCTDGDDFDYGIKFIKTSYGNNLKTWYNLSQALKPNTKYTLYINSTYNSTYNTDANGSLSFNTSNGWYGNVTLSRTCKVEISGSTIFDMINMFEILLPIIGLFLIIAAIGIIVVIIYGVVK